MRYCYYHYDDDDHDDDDDDKNNLRDGAVANNAASRMLACVGSNPAVVSNAEVSLFPLVQKLTQVITIAKTKRISCKII